MSAKPSPAEDFERIAAFLRAHPSFLSEHPDLYRVLTPPARVHGERMADHMAAMLRAARSQAAEMEAKAASVLEARREASGVAERVQEAVLTLVASGDVADCVANELPGKLGVDAASLCCEGFVARWRSLPAGAVKTLMRGKQVVFRDRPADAILLHAEAELLAERDALIRLPGRRPALLALVSRDPAMLPSLQGTQAFTFLGRVLAALIER